MSGREHAVPGAGGGDEERMDDDLDVFDFVDHGDTQPPDEGPAQTGPRVAPHDGDRGVDAGPAPARGEPPATDAAREDADPSGDDADPWTGLLAGSRAAAPRRPRRLRSALVLGAVGVAVLLALGLVVPGLVGGRDYTAVEGDEVTFTVEPGEGLDSVAGRMDEAGIVGSARALRRAASEVGSTTIGAGEFVLRERMPAAEALAVLQGRSRSAVHYVLVARGQRLTEVLDELPGATGLPAADFEAAAEDPSRYGVPEESPTLEGWLAPGEYRIPVSADAEGVLAELVKPRLEHLASLGLEGDDERIRVLTVASLLEAEALPRDYARVAGVIENRLAEDNDETHGLLQIDSAVTYGLGVRGLQFSAAQRADESNPYNTYQHPGLPPTPIGMPSNAAIDAALNPEESDDYYWVTTDIGTGHTEFSRTYEEHLVHVREFRAYCATNPGVC